MPQYFFALGKNPTLSSAEIISVLDRLDISFGIKVLSVEVLIIDTHKDLPIENLIKTLGGTIKIGKIINEVSLDENEQNFENIFEAENLITNYLPKKDGKLHFGISIYDGGAERNYLNEITNKLKTLHKTIKENLQEKELKAGFVRIKERYLSSVSVAKNRLLSDGFEMVLILTKDSILAGKTITVQEFESFSFRDYGRPQRDTRAGIIPPKLARMMINLAAVDKGKVLMDPFCGSGTILQEAIILGYRNIIGSDISKNAIADTQRNIDWLFNNFKQLERPSFDIGIFISDVKLISQHIENEFVDAIITEPFLGPPLFNIPDENSVQRIIREVETLYHAAFQSFHKILKINGKVVFLFPAFEINGKMHFVPILDKIEKMGFTKLELLPEELKSYNTVSLTQRNTILYGSREHFVKREITNWQKV